MVETLLEIAAPLLKAITGRMGKGLSGGESLPKEDLERITQLLSGRLIYLLRYMDHRPDPVYPRA